MTQEELAALFEQGEAVQSSDDSDDLAALFEQGEVVRETPGEQAAEGMNAAERALVGAGRGMTDVWQSGRQLFERYVDDTASKITGEGITEQTADQYQESVARERGTYEEGLGDDTAAGVGRLIGQAAPSLAIPAAGGGSLAARIAASAGGGAVGGGLVGAGQAAGLDEEEIVQSGAEGAGYGAAVGGAFPLLAQTLRATGSKLPSLEDISTFGTGMRSSEDVARSVARMTPNELAKMGVDETTQQFAQVLRNEGIDAAVAKYGQKAVDEMSNDLVIAFRDNMSVRNAITGAGRELKESAGSLSRGNLPELAQELTGLDLAATGAGFAVGGPIGAGVGLAASRLAPQAKAYVGAGIESTAEVVTNVLKNRPEALGKFAVPLQRAANRGASSLAATMHVMQQTDPAFRAKLEQLESEEE